MFTRFLSLALLLSALTLAGCGDTDADAGTRAGKQGKHLLTPSGPAVEAQGTLSDDVGQPRIVIPKVRPWEEYVEEHQAEHGGEQPPEPRTRMEIYDEDMALPRLFLTQSGARVIGAGNLRSHRDPQTGEECWPAMGCYNPECPQRDADGEPFAFLDNAASDIGRHCPACRELRDVANETPLDRNRWARWVRPHELPETAARRRELTEQRRQRIAWERANR